MADPRTPFPALGNSPTAQAIAQLRAELAALRAEVAEGVTTRRLVVVGPDGFERVVLTAEEDHGHVLVRTRTTGPDPTHADLFALDAEDPTDRPSVGLDLTDRGDPAARYTVTEGRSAHRGVHPPT